MKIENYEKTYTSVATALKHTEHLDRVVAILRKQTTPITCKDLGTLVFGEKYNKGYTRNSLHGTMGQMLRHLKNGGFIKVEELKGDPIEIEDEGWIPDPDDNGELARITVKDERGRTFTIDNPYFEGKYRQGHWGKIKKMVTPTTKIYTWIGE